MHHTNIVPVFEIGEDHGRIFYVMDEGKNFSVLLPPKHFLVARDAFNGTVLWKKPLPSWHPHLWPLKSGPAQLPRRLIAEGYLEGFANIYAEAARAIRAQAAGEPIPGDVVFPTVQDGLKGVAFVDACVRSSKRDAAWVQLAL